jgi:hypothetical protein
MLHGPLTLHTHLVNAIETGFSPNCSCAGGTCGNAGAAAGADGATAAGGSGGGLLDLRLNLLASPLPFVGGSA